MPTNSSYITSFGTNPNQTSANNEALPASTCGSCDGSYPNSASSCIPPPIYPPGQPTSNQFYSNPDNLYAAWCSYQQTTTVANGNTNYEDDLPTINTTPI